MTAAQEDPAADLHAGVLSFRPLQRGNFDHGAGREVHRPSQNQNVVLNDEYFLLIIRGYERGYFSQQQNFVKENQRFTKGNIF